MKNNSGWIPYNNNDIQTGDYLLTLTDGYIDMAYYNGRVWVQHGDESELYEEAQAIQAIMLLPQPYKK